jgi:hypothetical protein
MPANQDIRVHSGKLSLQALLGDAGVDGVLQGDRASVDHQQAEPAGKPIGQALG